MGRNGVTYIRIPVHLLALGLRSAHELALLGLAVGFNGKGIRMSNAELARLLQMDRRHVPRLVGRLVGQKYLRIETRDGRRIIHPTDTILVPPPDTNLVTKWHQSGDEVTPDLPCPSISEVTEGTEKRRARRKPKASDEDGALFDRFWSAYPKKVAKEPARKAWAKLRPDVGLTEQIIGSVRRYAETRQWMKDGGEYIPNPATFLNQGRWEDEIESAAQPKREPQRGDPDWLPTEEELEAIYAQC